MKEERAAVRISPWMHIVDDQGGVPLAELLPVSGRTYVARLDGRRMGNTDAVFEQFWDGIKLPEYFGWNWNALYDCLRDLTWLSADHHVLIIEAAEGVLQGDVDVRELLLSTLLRAGQELSYTKRPEGVVLSKLVVVMSCDAEAVPELEGLLRSL
ncbi:barstar family protein [Streptomyces sp. NPDC051219]|uniref:barstar family protein n=1 Tax=Streptomyces sp. NPDC051219 TaxID=3155283 RepID=UPI00344602D0